MLSLGDTLKDVQGNYSGIFENIRVSEIVIMSNIFAVYKS
jgi:hypothetical protein